MFQIIIWILKIIGILLAAILGIAVLLVCIVLFFPVRYRIEGRSEGAVEDLEVKAQFSWFLHLVSGYFKYEKGAFDWKIRIAWKKINQTDSDDVIPKESAAEKPLAENIVFEGEGTETRKIERRRRRKRKKLKKVSLTKKIKYTYRAICDKIKVFQNAKEKVIEFLSDTIHKSAGIRLKKELFRLLRFLRPKKLLGVIRFGLEDPYDTGRILAVLGMLYPFYGEHIDIYPDFERQVLQGNLLIKGHIRGIYAGIVLWNLFWDKQVRITYQHIKTFKF